MNSEQPIAGAVVLPGAISDDLPIGELKILAFIYDSGYTIKTDSALARIGGIPSDKIAGLIQKWEKRGWVNVRRFQCTNGKVTRWIIAAL